MSQVLVCESIVVDIQVAGSQIRALPSLAALRL